MSNSETNIAESLKGKTILIVDDMPDSVIAFKAALKQRGATTVVRRSVDSALRWFEQNRSDQDGPDLVVIDLFLPKDYQSLAHLTAEVGLNGNNQGEFLGRHLGHHLGEPIPYLYLTSERGFYSGTDKDLLFTKEVAQIGPFAETVVKLLSPKKGEGGQ